MHQVQFINKPFTLEQFQGSVDGRPVDLHLLLRHFEQSSGIEMLVCLFQDFEQRSATGSEPYSARRQPFAERLRKGGALP